MRGFLQRIATSAAGLDRNVHPFVGALYQSLPWEQAIEPALPLEGADAGQRGDRVETADAVPEAAAAEQCGNISRERPHVERSAAAEPQGVENVGGPQARQDATGPQVADTTWGPQVVEDFRAPQVADNTRGPQGVENIGGPQAHRAASERREETARPATRTERLVAASPTVLQPLLVGEMPKPDGIAEQVGVVAHRQEENQRANTGRAARRKDVTPNAPRRQEEHGLQDIQIHIGTIEVIAVPPPAPRAPAQQARKTMSLDEYLKQRDGRAR